MINWDYLSDNPSAIVLLENERNKINYNYLFSNPSIFILDYDKMRENNIKIYEELIEKVMKPSRVFSLIKEYPDYDYLEEMFDC